MGDRWIIVGIHDVSPSTLPSVRWLLSALDGLGIRRRVLKVIPNEAGQGDIRAHAPLVGLLRGEAAAGSEIVQHGYTHRSTGHLYGSLLDRLEARLFAPRDAEFVSVRPSDAFGRIRAGQQILAEAGFAPAGFCPPAWMGPRQLERELARAGFRYVVRLGSVRDLATDHRVWIPAVGYMGGGEGLERLTAIGNRLVGAFPIRPHVLRVFLHPQRAKTSPHNRAVLEALPRWLDGRRVTTYSELLGD